MWNRSGPGRGCGSATRERHGRDPVRRHVGGIEGRTTGEHDCRSPAHDGTPERPRTRATGLGSFAEGAGGFGGEVVLGAGCTNVHRCRPSVPNACEGLNLSVRPSGSRRAGHGRRPVHWHGDRWCGHAGRRGGGLGRRTVQRHSYWRLRSCCRGRVRGHRGWTIDRRYRAARQHHDCRATDDGPPERSRTRTTGLGRLAERAGGLGGEKMSKTGGTMLHESIAF